MSSIFIDHRTLSSYYTDNDVIVTNIYTLFGEFPSQNDRLILWIKDCKGVVINFNIKSITVSIGYLCLNGIIISKFHILKGSNSYQHLVLLYGNYVELILDKCCIYEVNVMHI